MYTVIITQCIDNLCAYLDLRAEQLAHARVGYLRGLEASRDKSPQELYLQYLKAQAELQGLEGESEAYVEAFTCCVNAMAAVLRCVDRLVPEAVPTVVARGIMGDVDYSTFVLKATSDVVLRESPELLGSAPSFALDLRRDLDARDAPVL